MKTKTTADPLRRQLASLDPAGHVTADELVRSRERSLAAMQLVAAPQEHDGVAVRGEAVRYPAATELSARRSRRAHTWLTSAAAAAVLAALITGDVLGLAGWRGGATAQAAEVLNKAAQTTIETTDPVVKPGQYLRIKSTNVWATNTYEQDGSQYRWLDTEKSDLYIPADRSAEWVWQRSGRLPTTFFDADSKDYALEQNIQPSPELLHARNGAFYGSPGGSTATDLSKLPRDPYRLLNSIYKQTLGHGQSVDGEALVFIADLLRTGVVPADLRAALYKAAALIPGVTVTEGQANLDGRTGVAIGRLEDGPAKSRQEIVIDPRTGLMIGERSVLTQAQEGFPAGTATTWTAIETSVSNTAP
ncbi:CU044_5270 family protein [Arthrobacter sp. B3I4]|uniref:CU044_5270 family protein n=1 Tax=Arthrobacter sp. B3I4 TaxID=3042267 RepID=UPI0027D845F6|nr:CU044_5270 family protein [Arthrobacter sp. B3I4]